MLSLSAIHLNASFTSDSSLFTPLVKTDNALELLESFPDPFEASPHAVSIIAAEHLQRRLSDGQTWQHNFGLADNQDGVVIGKMFGVLVVKDSAGTLGYIAAFSGKIGGSNHHAGFVPPVFDSLDDNSFLNDGMKQLAVINSQIKSLETVPTLHPERSIQDLKVARKLHSYQLQQRLYDQYHFLNQQSEHKSLLTLFQKAGYKNPPAGAGECAAPKLLQYAFQHKMQPLALAEFWWGLSPKSAHWKHGHYYPSCQEKCKPILAHMLSGLLG